MVTVALATRGVVLTATTLSALGSLPAEDVRGFNSGAAFLLTVVVEAGATRFVGEVWFRVTPPTDATDAIDLDEDEDIGDFPSLDDVEFNNLCDERRRSSERYAAAAVTGETPFLTKGLDALVGFRLVELLSLPRDAAVISFSTPSAAFTLR